MIIVEILDDRGRPHKITASRVLVRDGQHLTPVAVVMEVAPSVVIAGTAADADFQTVLKMTGIEETVLTTEYSKETLVPPSIQ